MVIKNITVINANEKPKVSDIYINGAKFGKGDEKEVYDGTGFFAYPGLIDIHTHLGMWEDGIGFEGDDGNESSEPSTPHLRAIDAVNFRDRCFEEALQNGITTVVTGPGSANPISGQLMAMKTYGNIVDEMALITPCAIKFSLGENPKTVHNEKEQAPITRMATAAIIREQLIKTQKYMSEENPDFDIKCEALVPLLKGEIKAHFHAHRADDIATAIRLSKEFGLKTVIIHGTEAHLISDYVKESGVDVVCGPLICDRSKPELRELKTENPVMLMKSGLNISVCTDHPVIPIQYLTASCAAVIKEGASENDMLCAVTVNPAKTIGLDKKIGKIKNGFDADLIICEGSIFDTRKKPKAIIAGGKIIEGEICKCGK